MEHSLVNLQLCHGEQIDLMSSALDSATYWSKGWAYLGASGVLSPTVCSRGVGSMEIYNVAPPNKGYHHRSFDNGVQAPWVSIGGRLFTPATCTYISELFLLTPLTSSNAKFESCVGATSNLFGTGRTDLFFKGASAGNTLFHKSWTRGIGFEPVGAY